MNPHLRIDAPLLAAAGVGGALIGWPAVALAAGVAVSLHSWAVVHPRCSWHGAVRWELPGRPSALALTFDDGPDPEVTPRVLDLLAAHGISATFFVIGRNAERAPELIRRIRAEGHALGLHGYSHSRLFPCWSRARVRADLQRNAALLADLTGEAPPTCFRPPMGLRNPLIGGAVRDLGLTCVTWTANARDTRVGSSTTDLLARLRPGLRPGGILVLHDGQEPDRPGHRTACLELIPALAAANPGLSWTTALA